MLYEVITELERVDLLLRVAHGAELDGAGLAHGQEPFGQAFHAVAVGHPDREVAAVLDPVKEDAVVLGRELGAAVFRITSYNVCYTKLLRLPQGRV